MESCVQAKGKWKRVKLASTLVTSNAMEGFAGLEVLHDYEMVRGKPKEELITDKKEGKKAKKVKELNDNSKKGKDQKQKKSDSLAEVEGKKAKKVKELNDNSKKGKDQKQKKSDGPAEVEKSTDEIVNDNDKTNEVTTQKTKTKKRKRKRKKKKGDTDKQDGGADQPDQQTTPGQKRKNSENLSDKGPKKKKKKKAKPSPKANQPQEDESEVPCVDDVDMSAWSKLFVPEPVLKAMTELGYTAPTPIQALALPPAIRDKMDIVGAAETGSGKTLAFGIPLLHHVIEYKSQQSQKPEPEDKDEEMEDEEVANEEENDDEMEEEEENDVEVEEEEEKTGSDTAGSDVDDGEWEWSDEELDEEQADPNRPLLGLVLAPTRELALQVQQHLKAVAKHTGLQVAAIVGGMATQKQERVLKKCPEIIVATPGRLWELIKQGQGHLSRLEEVRYLVIDEADRMVEKGHFQELTEILLRMNRDEDKRRLRQNFVFSATLTFVHSGPNRLIVKDRKKKVEKMTQEQKIESLGSAIGIKTKHKLIDLTRKEGTAEQLTESRINCTQAEEKDLYLYYFLTQFPGRTIVFGNSKDSIRRLSSVLTILQCKPLTLHADMHQKQRLKNLDKFKADSKGLLLATDVAARGLDIPQVEHVVHFQVPRTTENYIHRSGRTARASREGLSIMLVCPTDMRNYRKIISTLKRDEDLPMFPVDNDIMNSIKDRVSLARDIDQQEHRHTRAHNENNWFLKAAKEADLELDEEELGLHDMSSKRKHDQKMQQLRQQLNALLQQQLVPRFFSPKYPTKSGKLLLPLTAESTQGKAVGAVKQERKAFKNELSKVYPAKSKVKPKKKWKEKKWQRLQKESKAS